MHTLVVWIPTLLLRILSPMVRTMIWKFSELIWLWCSFFVAAVMAETFLWPQWWLKLWWQRAWRWSPHCYSFRFAIGLVMMSLSVTIVPSSSTSSPLWLMPITWQRTPSPRPSFAACPTICGWSKTIHSFHTYFWISEASLCIPCWFWQWQLTDLVSRFWCYAPCD